MADDLLPVKINTLEIENAMRIKSAKIELNKNGLTVIGGNNKQGKTTVLKIAAYIFGGERYKPETIKREGSLADPEMRAVLSNGLVVERKGKNHALKVTDPSGATYGQTLLNELIHVLALDLPKFINAKSTERTGYLLQVLGVGDQLSVLEREEKELYDKRHAFGQIADQKKKYAEELAYYPDAPNVPVSAKDLIKEQQIILAKNGENQKLRENVLDLEGVHEAKGKEVEKLKQELSKAEVELKDLAQKLKTARKTAEELEDESTEEIEAKLNEIDAINVQVRANMDKDRANEEAEEHQETYNIMTRDLEAVREEKSKLLNSVDWPLPGLSVEKGELLYEGKPWDCMAGSDQLIIGTAIVQKINPKCGFVLMDGLEAMDLASLQSFDNYLKEKGLQTLGTRVSKGDECSIIIEDGFTVSDGKKTFVKGEF